MAQQRGQWISIPFENCTWMSCVYICIYVCVCNDLNIFNLRPWLGLDEFILHSVLHRIYTGNLYRTIWWPCILIVLKRRESKRGVWKAKGADVLVGREYIWNFIWIWMTNLSNSYMQGWPHAGKSRLLLLLLSSVQAIALKFESINC